MVTEVRPEQRENAPLPMLLTELGMLTEVRPEQLLNALLPILVTELPMVTEIRPVQPEYVQLIIIQSFAVNTIEKSSRFWAR